MRVLRTGGEFTAMQMWKQRLGIVLSIAATRAIAAASALLSHPAGMIMRLPDDYVLLNDVVLPGHRGNIDHVLILSGHLKTGHTWTGQNRP